MPVLRRISLPAIKMPTNRATPHTDIANILCCQHLLFASPNHGCILEPILLACLIQFSLYRKSQRKQNIKCVSARLRIRLSSTYFQSNHLLSKSFPMHSYFFLALLSTSGFISSVVSTSFVGSVSTSKSVAKSIPSSGTLFFQLINQSQSNICYR
jgi:hypothetical protein